MLNKLFNYQVPLRMVIISMFVQIIAPSAAQTVRDSLSSQATLSGCVEYALHHQPAVQQSILDESITGQNIRIALSGWMPRINAEGDYQHNIKLPVFFFLIRMILQDLNNKLLRVSSIHPLFYCRLIKQFIVQIYSLQEKQQVICANYPMKIHRLQK